MPPLVDVVVCSKDRPEHLASTIQLIEKHVPFHHIYVVDSSPEPLKPNNGYITVFHEPKLCLGAARNFALNKVTTEFMFGMDDDIQITADTFNSLYGKLKESNDNAVAVPIMPYGNEQTKKLIFASRKISGGTGVFLARTDLLRKIGGFADVNYGEDLACTYRVKNAGYCWVTAATVCFHPSTLLGNMQKSWRNGYYMIDIYRDNPNARNILNIVCRSVVRVFGSIFFGFRTWDLTCFKWSLLPKFCFVAAWFKRILR